MEPLIMACFFPKDLYFLVRGDVFDNPVLKPLLIATHQIPIYRFRDGFSKLRENNQTVDTSVDVLRNKNSLLIFAEGSTKSIRMVRPLQKGLARIVTQASKQMPDTDIEVVPVGINFSHATTFRREVFLRVGPPMSLRSFYEIKDDAVKSDQEGLLNAVCNAMKDHVIHLDHQDRSKTAEQVFSFLWRMPEENILPVAEDNLSKLDFMKKIATSLDSTDENMLEQIRQKISVTEKALKKSKLSLSDLHKTPASIKDYLLLVIGFLPAAYGYVFNFIPVVIGMWFTKLKVKQKEFKSSVLMVSVFLMVVIWYFAWMVFVINKPQFFLLPLTGLVTGWVFLIYSEYLKGLAVIEDYNKIKEAKNTMMSIVEDLGVDIPIAYKTGKY
jgi:glycerol-3-phosphate O-acyltransferase / dihydroxyacetone phosphate acyltransferase